MPIGDRLFMLLLAVSMIGILLVIFVLPFYLVFGGGIQKFGAKPLRRCYENIQLLERGSCESVSVVYHTYRGLLIWFVQDEHSVTCSPADAKLLMGRLLRFNLTWGMLSYGVVFVPFLAYFNYRQQVASIDRHIKSLGI